MERQSNTQLESGLLSLKTPEEGYSMTSIASSNTNNTFLLHKSVHRKEYSGASFYEWQSNRKGKDRLFKQNDKAYGIYVRKVPGLHELHLAEELHRFWKLNVYYQDHNSRVKVDPSVPPMGDPFNFHGSKWKGRKFDQMWQYWVQCYPAHAHDIECE